MATFINQRDAAITAYEAIIFPNNTGLIDGLAHQLSGVGQLESVYQNLVGYDNYSYVIVRTGVDSTGAEVNTSAQNGLNLLAAYNAAKLLTPGGNPVSWTNRVAVLVPAGIYDLGSSQIEADTSGVDLIGIGDKKDVIIRSNDAGISTIYQTADDVVFKNFTAVQLADTSATGRAAYELPDSTFFTMTLMKDVVLSGNSFFTSNATINPSIAGFLQYYAGTFENVICRFSNSPVWDGIVSGTWKDCVCEFAAGWSVNNGWIDNNARFERCVAAGGFGTAGGAFHGGTYIDCETTTTGFGGPNCTITGTYKNCKGSNNAFGYLAASVQGTFINCQAGDQSFGWGGSIQGATMIDCVGGNECFGQSDAVSVFQNCRGGLHSFNTQYPFPGTLAGTYINCTGSDGSFGGALISVPTFDKILSGKFYNCVGGAGSFGGQSISVGEAQAATCVLSGEFYGCTASSYSFGTRFSELSGTFVRCSAQDYSFGSGISSSTKSVLSGTFNYCNAGDFSFGTCAIMEASAVFNYCKAGIQSFGSLNNGGAICNSKFYNCVGGNTCWVYPSSPVAEYINCTAGTGSFGFGTFPTGTTLAGKYVDCNAGLGSFGTTLLSSGYTINLSGTFIRCSAGDNSFSFQTGAGSTSSISGKMYDCKAGANSFASASAGGGNVTTIASGAILDNCTAGDGSFASLSGGTKIGELKNCRTYNYLTGTTGMASDNGVLSGVMRDCLWTITNTTSPALNIAAGAKIYGGEYRAGATATRSIVDSTGLGITASLANVMVSQIVDPLITNNITSPNVIVDTDI